MSIRFLSEEWAAAVMEAVNGTDEFSQAAGTAAARIQQVITKPDGGVAHYWTVVADGRIELGLGDIENPDATITQSYETAVALAKSELSPVTAFMTGKVKVGGNMGLLLSLQGVLTQLPDAMRAIDVQY